MEIIDTYLVRWYGPFSSRLELKKWELQRKEKFSLYIFQAQKKGALCSNYYCGMTYKQSIAKRMGNHDHHIHDFEDDKTELLEIWVGTISNIEPSEYDIRMCENLLTSGLANLSVGRDNMENRINMTAPIRDIYMITEWWKKDDQEVKKRTKGSVPAIVPEVLVYYTSTNAVYGVNNLKYLGKL